MDCSPRLLTLSAIAACAGLLAVASCTRTTDRIVEPVGGGDASTTSPEVGDSGVGPIGPIALPPPDEASEDFRLVRAPEFGLGRERVEVVHVGLAQPLVPGSGGTSGASGTGGVAGSDRRPVSCGGAQ